MGQQLSCITNEEQVLFSAIQLGDLETVDSILQKDSNLIHYSKTFDCNTALHIAASNGKIQVLSLLLERFMKPDSLNRQKQTPLMVAVIQGKISCVTKLIEAGANILMFDSPNGRTCLHYAAYYGHLNCLEAILSAARDSHVSASWGYSRFVNIRDGKGATPLHLAARRRRPECVRMLLDNGALVCALTSGYGSVGSTPLHLAARSGSIDCIRELLAWGADRLQTDASGRIPYTVALRHHHRECAALLNPSSAEPLVWPSPLKFISELNDEAKALLERALKEANKEREMVNVKGTVYPIGTCESDSDREDICGICFDEICSIEVRECGHQMCAQCTLVLCCHTKPDPTTASPSTPVCPFCRSNIVKLVVAKDGGRVKGRKSRSGEGSRSSGSFRALSTFAKMGRGSG